MDGWVGVWVGGRAVSADMPRGWEVGTGGWGRDWDGGMVGWLGGWVEGQ